MTMHANEFTKQVLDFQRGAFTGWYDAISLLQDQAASAVDKMLNQTGWIPDEGRQAISGWISACQNERDRYRDYMEESISGLQKYFAQDAKAAPAGPHKPAAQAKTAAPAAKSKSAAVEPKMIPAAQETKQPNL